MKNFNTFLLALCLLLLTNAALAQPKPKEDSFKTKDGVKIVYYVIGKGSPVILIHGYTGSNHTGSNHTGSNHTGNWRNHAASTADGFTARSDEAEHSLAGDQRGIRPAFGKDASDVARSQKLHQRRVAGEIAPDRHRCALHSEGIRAESGQIHQRQRFTEITESLLLSH
jgi:hypothetical protein